MDSTGPEYGPVAGLYEYTKDVSGYIKIVFFTNWVTAHFSKSTLHHGSKRFVFNLVHDTALTHSGKPNLIFKGVY